MNREGVVLLLTLIIILIVLFLSTSIIEKRLQTMEKQNNQIIDLLKEWNDKDS
ncbi:hypothetical protein [Gracilibacillus timonensis]|uniref:hypothetical protein n=1 Tax=Gracilibacillus timonensis TaxID=1816696 RepID=UPI000A4D0509|nr:hypothetical protein [Gracilibacillus timonensis]